MRGFGEIVQNVLCSFSQFQWFNWYRVKNCNFLTLSLGFHGNGFVSGGGEGGGGQNILLQLYRKGNIAAFWKQKNKSQIVCKGDKSTLRVSTFPKKQSITNGWKTSTTMDNR